MKEATRSAATVGLSLRQRDSGVAPDAIRLVSADLKVQVCNIDDPRNPKENELLAALPDAEWQRWLPMLEWVELPLGKILYESGNTLSHVYFPTTAVIALLFELENGASSEIAVVGNEGVVGISLFMGGESTPSRALVQCAGSGLRLNAEALKSEFSRGGAVQHLLLRYTQALITQMILTAACNRHHSLDQQMCRWLLLSLDHLGANELVTTEDVIASMVGARRDHVIERAHRLQRDGAILYTSGNIKLLDRKLLEERSCECYQAIKMESGRLLPRMLAS